MFHSIVCVVVALLATLQSSSALHREIEGFTHLVSIPSSSNTAEFSTKASSYYVSTTTATWHVAFSRCSQLKGKLATPLNPEEDNTLRDSLVDSIAYSQPIWTSGYKTTSWRWEANNVNMLYENFQNAGCKSNSGQCLYANSPSGGKWGWCGGNCATANHYVCQF